MKLKNECHVIVADSEKYLILRNQGDEGIMDLRVVHHEEYDNPPSREQVTDKPGRLPSPNAQKSAVEDTDWHLLQKEQTVSNLALRINELFTQNFHHDLVIIADPKTLGGLRPQLSDNVQVKIKVEIAKDLVNHTTPHIEDIIQAA